MRSILLLFILVLFVFPSTSGAQEKHSAARRYAFGNQQGSAAA